MDINDRNFKRAQREQDYILWLALRHHITHKRKRLDFIRHAYLKAIYHDQSDYMIIKKSTQCGISEYLIVRAIGKSIKGKNVFYVLPTYDLVNRMVRNRFDKTIGFTDFYKELEKITKLEDETKRAESMTLKDIGAGSIAFVGSNSTAGFTEYPADEVIIDELDECNPDNIAMAWERLSASEDRSEIKVANPKIEGTGIDAEFVDTDMLEWTIQCEYCDSFVVIDWFKHVVREVEERTYIIRDTDWEWGIDRDIYPICDKCGKPLNRMAEGFWNSTGVGKKRGYHISKFFSGSVTMLELVNRFNEGLKNNTKLQRFYNADLGLAFTAKGAKINKEMLDALLSTHRNKSVSTGFGVMGIDVGNVLNIIIGDLLPTMAIKITYIGEVTVEVSEVVRLVRQHNVRIGVIDALPEQHFVQKLKIAIPNIFSCYYQDSKKAPIDMSRNVSVDRTASMDAVQESILTQMFLLPMNAESVPKFYDQMMTSTRIFDEKANKGRGNYKWVESGPDHYHHAMNYLLIARKLIWAMQHKK